LRICINLRSFAGTISAMPSALSASCKIAGWLEVVDARPHLAYPAPRAPFPVPTRARLPTAAARRAIRARGDVTPFRFKPA
jgi:hypothetical protein